MGTLNRLWAGRLFGTNTGNLFAELIEQDGAIVGSIRLLDADAGLILYNVRGEFRDGKVSLYGAPAENKEEQGLGEITAVAALNGDGALNGEWRSTVGTAGTFQLFPHAGAQAAERKRPNLPEQVQIATRHLGALRLYGPDVRELLRFVERDFEAPKVTVTYLQRGNEVTRWAAEFETELSSLGELRYLKIVAQEPEAYGVNRMVVIDVGPAVNVVRVQGVQESWVIGKVEALATHLRRYERSISTAIFRHGLSANQVVAVGALIMLPELPLGRRAIFVAAVVAALLATTWAHGKLVPNAVIHLSERQPGVVERAWPSIVSWTIAATSALAASVVYGLLSGDWPLS